MSNPSSGSSWSWELELLIAGGFTLKLIAPYSVKTGVNQIVTPAVQLEVHSIATSSQRTVRILQTAKSLTVWAFAGSLFFTAPARVEAQDVTFYHGALDAGVLMRSSALGVSTQMPRLAPELAVDNRWLHAVATGDVTGSEVGWRIDHTAFEAAASPTPFGPFRLDLAAHAERFALAEMKPRQSLGAQSTLSIAHGTVGAWSGMSTERDSAFSGSGFLLGAWKQFGNAVISIGSGTRTMHIAERTSTISHVLSRRDSVFNDTLGTYTYYDRVTNSSNDSGSVDRTRLFSELQAHVSYVRGAVLFEGIVGTRPAVDQFARALWGRVRTTVSVSPRVAIVASAGNDMSRITLGMPQTRVFSLGVRMAAVLPRGDVDAPVRVAASAFSVRSAGDSSVVVSITVPGARVVELAGDFDGWAPVTLGQVSAGTWEVSLRLRPGTYRMNVRVDGDGWRAPPGVATTTDEFNGTVGLVVVR